MCMTQAALLRQIEKDKSTVTFPVSLLQSAAPTTPSFYAALCSVERRRALSAPVGQRLKVTVEFVMGRKE